MISLFLERIYEYLSTLEDIAADSGTRRIARLLHIFSTNNISMTHQVICVRTTSLRLSISFSTVTLFLVSVRSAVKHWDTHPNSVVFGLSVVLLQFSNFIFGFTNATGLLINWITIGGFRNVSNG